MNLDETLKRIECRINNFNAAHSKFENAVEKFEPLEPILQKGVNLPSVTGSKKVLIWRGQGLAVPSLNRELIYAASLIYRNVNVEFVLCDGLLSGCLERSITEYEGEEHSDVIKKWHNKCATCCYRGTSRFKAAGVKYSGMSKWVPLQRRAELRYFADNIDVADIRHFRMHENDVGKEAFFGAIRYYKGREMLDEINTATEKILREYFFSSLVATEAAKGAIDEIEPDRVIMGHGIFPLWGGAFSYSVSRDIPVTRFRKGYRDDHIYMRTSTKNDRQHMLYANTNHWDNIKDKPLADYELLALKLYMMKNESHSSTGLKLFDSLPSSPELLREKLNLPEDKPVWLIAAHVNWDAVFALDSSLHRDSNQWLLEVCETASNNKEVTWILRVHPAERHIDTVSGSRELILREFDRIPDNIRIISASDDINTYGLLAIVDGCVTIKGTLGLESALFGKPVILAGCSHYSAKGFADEPSTREEFVNLLQNAHKIPPLSAQQLVFASRYAYDYFIRRQIPLFEILTRSGGKYEISDFSELKDNPIMDMICSRIFDGGQFALDRRQLAERTNREAMSFFSAGQYDKASRKFDSASGYDNTFPDPYYNKGVVCYHRGDTESAAGFFRRALDISPGNKSYAAAFTGTVKLNEWIRKGYELFSSGNCDQAENIFREIIKIAPNHGIARNCLGTVLWRTGRNNDALAEFGNAIKLLPDNREVVWTVGQFLWSMGRANDAAALYCSYIQRHRDEKEMVQTVLQWQDQSRQIAGSELQNLNSSPLHSSGDVLQVTR